MFINKIDMLDYPNSAQEYNENIDIFLNDNTNYGLLEVDEIFNKKVKKIVLL